MSNIENKLKQEDLSIHDWYRFVLSFPPHLVRQYIDSFGIGNHDIVLDPFCGTGTTNVECKKLGICSWGIEASPITHFASRTKSTWITDVSTMMIEAECIVEKAKRQLDFADCGFCGTVRRRSRVYATACAQNHFLQKTADQRRHVHRRRRRRAGDD